MVKTGFPAPCVLHLIMRRPKSAQGSAHREIFRHALAKCADKIGQNQANEIALRKTWLSVLRRLL
jgi:hypothetical protein